MMELSIPIHLLQITYGFIHFPSWSCPIYSPYLEVFLWFLLRNVRSRHYLQQVRSRTPLAQPLDPSLVHLRTQGFCPICEFKQKWRWACTLTHLHSTGMLVKAHTWHSLESHIQICRSPVGDQHWPSACLDPGPHACQLYQPEVCQQMIHTQSVHTPFGVDVDTSSPSSHHQVHGRWPWSSLASSTEPLTCLTHVGLP